MHMESNRAVVIIAGLVIAALWVGSVIIAQQDHHDVTEQRYDAGPVPTRIVRAREIGRQIWGTICHGDVTITVAPLAGNQIGWSSWVQTPTERFTECAIVISNRKTWPWLTLCSVVVHELGHLVGREHNDNPRSIMFYKASSQNVPSRCRASHSPRAERGTPSPERESPYGTDGAQNAYAAW